MNILVPTDFSDLSKVAVQYAVKAANKLNGSLTLLHFFNMVEPTRNSMKEKYEALEKELVKYAKEDFATIIQSVDKFNKTGNPIAAKVEKGPSFSDTIRKVVRKQKTDLIIMGTKGASGLQKFVLGSNAASIIEACPVPVLVVPEDAKFSSVKNMVYATDLTTIDQDLKALVPFARLFGATLHIVHVLGTGKMEAAKEQIAKAWQKADYKKITVAIQPGKDVAKVVESYVETVEADMVALFTTQKSFYDKLFDRSITRRMTFQTHTPLLAFKH
jgi:nucleotide-binding universal stress UspA family protein